MPITCVHVPDFPAWAFARAGRHTGRPVAVVAAGRVVAANRLARRAGVAPGMSSERARALLPDGVVCLRDPALEAAAWEEALRDLHATTPFLEDAGPGWAFLRDAEDEAVRALVNRLSAQAGTGETRALARLAALRAAPGNVLTVAPEHAALFLLRFEVEGLAALGFDVELLERLRLLGYPNLRATSALSLRHLRAQFGTEGARLHALLHPGEEPPVAAFRPPPALVASADLEVPAREPADLLPVLDHLVAEATGALGALHSRRITVRLTDRAQGSDRLASRVLPEATQSARRIGQTARALLLPLLSAETEAESVAVELGGLGRASLSQASLFGERPSVYLAVRGVHRRFPGAVKRAVVVLHALFEEDAVRFEPFPEAPPPTRRRRSAA